MSGWIAYFIYVMPFLKDDKSLIIMSPTKQNFPINDEAGPDLPIKHSMRPWGMITLLVRNKNCSVDWTIVNSGGKTSLHSHKIRDELWVLLDVGGKVVIGNKKLHPNFGDEILIKKGIKHRLINDTNHSIRMIVISFNEWKEDDQIRHKDAYGRKGQPVSL